MAYIYDGDNGVDVVKQTNTFDYDEIYTYGGRDDIRVTLGHTDVFAGSSDDKVRSTYEGYNNVDLGSGNDTYTGYGFSTNSARFDVVLAGTGNDTMNVWTNFSEYEGEDGNDTFNSVGFNNVLDGGTGTDTVSYKMQDDDEDLSGFGIDVNLTLKSASSGGSREEELYSIENVVGTSYADDIIGSSSNNKLMGGYGADIVDGKGGKDQLYGNGGNDDLYGGSNNDKLAGGAGNDLLEGGTGADGFFFFLKSDSVVGSKRDVITDFYHSEGDYINLSGIDAINGGSDDEFEYIGSASFSDTAGELRFKNGILAGDTNGDGSADFEIKVVDVSKFYQSDLDL